METQKTHNTHTNNTNIKKNEWKKEEISSLHVELF